MIFTMHMLVLAQAYQHWTHQNDLLLSKTNKFKILGKVLPNLEFIRFQSLGDYAKGGIVLLAPVEYNSYETEVVFNCTGIESGKGVGMSVWYTNATYQLGDIYGLNNDFSGIAVIFSGGRLHAFQSYNLTDASHIHNSPYCDLDSSDKVTVHIKISLDVLEVWVKDTNLIKKCLDVPITPIYKPYVGLSAYTGPSTAFDVHQINTKLIPDDFIADTSFNQALTDLEHKGTALLHTLKSTLNAPEYQDIVFTLSKIKAKTENLINRLKNIQGNLTLMHLDDEFTGYANLEIEFLSSEFFKISSKVDDVVYFVDSKEILLEVDQGIQQQYLYSSGIGDHLVSEFEYSEKVYQKFEQTFENDHRLLWVHLGVLALLFAALFICVKVSLIEKTDTLTKVSN